MSCCEAGSKRGGAILKTGRELVHGYSFNGSVRVDTKEVMQNVLRKDVYSGTPVKMLSMKLLLGMWTDAGMQ